MSNSCRSHENHREQTDSRQKNRSIPCKKVDQFEKLIYAYSENFLIYSDLRENPKYSK